MAAFCLIAALATPAGAEDWPQFRGVNAGGKTESTAPLPLKVSPKDHVIWKTETPAGHSSPVVVGDRIFMTGEREKKLVTFALDRRTGKALWQADAPYDTLEPIHKTGSFAQSTPAADGEVVVSLFGSSGLHAYDRDGKLLWSHRFGPFKNDFGAGSSPIIADDRVVIVQDHDVGSFIAAFDKKTGKEIWRTDRSDFLRGYATPILWKNNGRGEIVVSGSLRVVGYDLETGAENWTVRGTARIVNMTPVVGADNTLYVATYSPGGDDGARFTPPSTDELFAADADKNGTIELAEFPENPFKQRYTQIDRDKDEHISRAEYESVRRALAEGRNVVLAIKPGGKGDITNTHVQWEYTRQIPYCPSPLFLDDVLYFIKDGGILTSLDAKTGKVIKQGRVKATGNYYASPIAGDDKIYLLDQNGRLTVVTAGGQWKELHAADFEADGHGTPAIADGRIYARFGNQLYCFGDPQAQSAKR